MIQCVELVVCQSCMLVCPSGQKRRGDSPEVLFGAEGRVLTSRNCWRPDLLETLKQEKIALLVPLKSRTHEKEALPANLMRLRRRPETAGDQFVGRLNAKGQRQKGVRLEPAARGESTVQKNRESRDPVARRNTPLRSAELIED